MLITSITNFVQNLYGTFGYAGLMLAMALESCLIPLPSEIVMPLAGYFTIATFANGSHFNIWLVALVGSIGSVIGSAAAYGIGAYGGRPFIMRYGRYILISRHDFDLADRWFLRYGNAITFFSRMLPIVRTYISLPAGIARMNFGKFLLYTFLGSLPWCLLLAFLGQKLGSGYAKLGSYFHGLDAVIVVAFVVLVALYIYRHIRNERAYDERLRAAQDPDATKKLPRMRSGGPVR
jgi:membrane protein DedA with SNARE-associated domain